MWVKSCCCWRAEGESGEAVVGWVDSEGERNFGVSETDKVYTARLLSVIVVDVRYSNRCFGKMGRMV